MSSLSESTIALIDSLKSTTSAYGLAGTGSEYKIVTEIFLYKFFNDKFGYEAKKNPLYGERLSRAEKWDAEYDTFTDDEVEDLFSFLPGSVPRLKPIHTLSHIFNAAGKGDFAAILDATLIDIANLNSDTFSVSTSEKSKVNIFSSITTYITDIGKRDKFARSLVNNVTSFNFEHVFDEKYDFFSHIFEHLLKGFNNAGGGKYAEYYTPRAIAQVMARLLVGDNSDLRSKTCYDPSAGTGTLLMALAHQIGEDRCSVYSQDISEKSSELLRLNLILNNLSASLPNVIQGNTLLEPFHKNNDESLKKFDYIVSNPPFNLDFPEYRKTLVTQTSRFWAGVPNAPKKIGPKPKMAIYTCFLQHVINSLNEEGKAAIVVPSGFLAAPSGIEKKIRQRLVQEKWIYGVISMPSNVFATTGTSVSVLFIDKKNSHNNVILIDASKLGEKYKEGNNKRTRLRDFEVNDIVSSFEKREAVDSFAVVPTYDEMEEKGYSFSAGQYFDVKIEHIDITPEEFKQKMSAFMAEFNELSAQSAKLDEEIRNQMGSLWYE